eukprot:CAMPEP_0170172564 /NCGR_PEP_ID=MMETSP0040_2-20121228/5806_1 /TAXON_ID=641309 /ORGANISM="Lotharella oceanica, Strain CCMP622" /LENGTH=346 /DNA_ID=CAMNT_0010413289 /DNA_START=94 /DNA_END=1135 /DNA_ORIENTATION=-
MVKNNYKSGRVATLMEGGFAGNEAQDPTVVGEPYPIYGSATTMNMNELLLNNIRADMYFREELPPIKTWEVFITKTIKEVKECTPWVTGTHTVTTKKGMCSGTRGVGTQGRPTRMWMHLVKLFTLKPTERQIESLIVSKQSPFLRVLGFLYIRYCVKREEVWDWLSPYIDDTEKIQIERLTETFWPLGRLVRTLLTETKYYDTHLPRLPVLLSRQIVQGIKDWDKSQGRKEGEDPFGMDEKEGEAAQVAETGTITAIGKIEIGVPTGGTVGIVNATDAAGTTATTGTNAGDHDRATVIADESATVREIEIAAAVTATIAVTAAGEGLSRRSVRARHALDRQPTMFA